MSVARRRVTLAAMLQVFGNHGIGYRGFVPYPGRKARDGRVAAARAAQQPVGQAAVPQHDLKGGDQ
ncbi:hypothetical protein AB0158_28085, partial [Klebsiella pneumoniae]